MSEIIPVFLASDNNFAPFVSTTVISVMENTKSNIQFYVLHNNICEQYQKKILDLQLKYNNCSIEFLKVDSKIFSSFPKMDYVNETMYFRYLIPTLKPDIKKAIYSDVDVIFNGDIKELYAENLENYPIGAVEDFIENENTEFLKTHYEELDINENHKYFWSGLLLINCEKCRENNYDNLLIDATAKYADKLFCPDANVYNIIFSENNYKPLHPKYVFIPQFEQKMLNMSANYADAAKNPFIYHYAESTPWLNKTINCAGNFWQIAEISPFYEEIKQIYKTKWTYKIFSIRKLNILSIQRTIKYFKVKLLNKITLFKIFEKNNYRHYQLLGFITIFKKKTQAR